MWVKLKVNFFFKANRPESHELFSYDIIKGIMRATKKKSRATAFPSEVLTLLQINLKQLTFSRD